MERFTTKIRGRHILPICMIVMLAFLLAACGGSGAGSAADGEPITTDDDHGDDLDHQDEFADLEPQVEAGDSMADVEMTLLNGDTIRIGDYAGKVVLLFFWSTDWNAQSGPKQVGKHNDLKADEGLVAFGVNPSGEPLGSIENYLDEFTWPLPVVLDEDQTLVRMFGARLGTMVWIGPESDLKSIVEEYKFTELRDENVEYRLRIYLGDS